MSAQVFELIGFASGRSDPPNFVEPVFVCSERLCVQSSGESSDIVSRFVPYDEELQIIEASSHESVMIGGNKIFAVRDIGERIVCGYREFVSKYLRQSLKNYIDKPYFWCEAARFLEYEVPEMQFINSNVDLIETAALANSVGRFCRNEVWNIKNNDHSIYKHRQLRTGNAYEIVDIIVRGSDTQTVFERWLEFSMDDAPRLSKASRWKDVDKICEIVFAENKKRTGRLAILYLYTARNILRDEFEYHDRNKLKPAQKDRETQSYGKIPINIFLHMPSLREAEGGDEDRSSVSGNRTKVVADWISRTIREKISEGKLSKSEVSMSVYFLNLVIKFVTEHGK